MSAPPPSDISRTIIHTRLEDASEVCIRPIVPGDAARMREGIGQLSSESRYLRFFSGQAMPPDKVIERLVDADGKGHIAWGAILSEGGAHPAIGAVHAVRTDPGSPSAEFSIGLLDAYHGLGLARILTAVLAINCRAAGIVTLDIQVLSENRTARRFVKSLGALRRKSEYSVTEYTLEVAGTIDRLRTGPGPRGLADVFAALAGYV